MNRRTFALETNLSSHDLIANVAGDQLRVGERAELVAHCLQCVHGTIFSKSNLCISTNEGQFYRTSRYNI